MHVHTYIHAHNHTPTNYMYMHMHICIHICTYTDVYTLTCKGDAAVWDISDNNEGVG